ncbi:STAS domain-containing protein [Streptomyces sp. NPDC051577]|uniref:STAS domain-containing protein n=1 Tax=Streptomyces sp. NPDC051577 TaxID=3155166 RepID=UPI003430090C
MRTPIDAPILSATDTAIATVGLRAPAAAAETGAQAGPDPLPRIRSTLHDGVLTVTLAGEFDHWSCAPMRRLLDEGAARGARRLVVDAARVSFCDSALLHVLDRWVRAGGSWELAGASHPVRLLLSVSRAAGVPVRRPG